MGCPHFYISELVTKKGSFMNKELQKQVENIFPDVISDTMLYPYAVQMVDSKEEIENHDYDWEGKEFHDEHNSFPILYLTSKDINCHFLFNIYINRNFKEFYVRLCSCRNPAIICDKEPFVSPLFTIEIPDNNLDKEKTVDILFNKYLEFTIIPWIKNYVKRNEINLNIEDEADWFIPSLDFDGIFFFTRSQGFLEKKRLLVNISDCFKKNDSNKESDFKMIPGEEFIIVDVYGIFNSSSKYLYFMYKDYIYMTCKDKVREGIYNKIVRQLSPLKWSVLND